MAQLIRDIADTRFAHYIILIDWCLTPTIAVFQLYRAVKKMYILTWTHTRPLEIKNKKLVYKITGLYV
jgi:hypothetical protein